jgi:hypothetical protein
MVCEDIMTMQQAAEYVGYKNKRRFMENWVRKNKVPYELRGSQKIFLRSNLDRYLHKIAEDTAKKIFAPAIKKRNVQGRYTREAII